MDRNDRPCMSKDEIRAGLEAGRKLVQEEWCNPAEVTAIDELVDEGVAEATPWQWHDNFQCERRIVTRAAAPSQAQQRPLARARP